MIYELLKALYGIHIKNHKKFNQEFHIAQTKFFPIKTLFQVFDDYIGSRINLLFQDLHNRLQILSC